MKSLYPFTLIFLFFGAALFPAQATFSSLYVFGDGLSTTTENVPASPDYYGQRNSNGRVWVEVLAQRQGLTYVASQNNSYFGHNSATLVNDLNSFTAPANASNALFIVWVCNADTFNAAAVPDNSTQWDAAINQSQINHSNIIAKLYAKGVRTLILPNAVDISKIPAYNTASSASLMSQKCISYNVAFSNTISQARLLFTNLTIYVPDYFTLLNTVLTNAAYYGLTNVAVGGLSIDALGAYNYGFPHAATNGFGTNFIYWDNVDPTAKFHAVIADEAQKLLPQLAQISKITPAIGGCQLDVTNWPGGLNGFVEGATNLASASWITNLVSFASTNTTPSVFVPASGQQWFYRLQIPYYPYTWSWP